MIDRVHFGEINPGRNQRKSADIHGCTASANLFFKVFAQLKCPSNVYVGKIQK